MRKRNKTKINKRNKRKSRKLRGGTVMPFSEVGSFFSGITSSLQGAMSTFTVLPSGYNPPNNPDISKQFLSPSSTTIQQIVNKTI